MLGKARSRLFLLGALLLCCTLGLKAAGPFGSTADRRPEVRLLLADGGRLMDGTFVVQASDSVLADGRHGSRALAAGLALTLGPFGAHRHYLGSKPVIPVLYALTFGGFGVLVLIDIGHILFTKDLSRFEGNNRMLMWSEDEVTRP